MSTATDFKFHRSFPFCPGNYLSSFQAGSIASLADLMQLGWNLETFKLNISASVSVAAVVSPPMAAASNSFSGSFTISPFSDAGDVTAGVASWKSIGGMWLPTSGGVVTAATMPAIVAPNARVCETSGPFLWIDAPYSFATNRSCQVIMRIRPLVDGSNLRLGWDGVVNVSFSTVDGQSYGILCGSNSSFNSLGGGTLDFGVASMPYYSQASSSGGAIISASGSISISDVGFFTY